MLLQLLTGQLSQLSVKKHWVILQRLALKIYRIISSAIILSMVALLVFSACSPSHKGEVDELNSISYAYHYRDLDSTKHFAEKALSMAGDYPAGAAEAHNNLAFVCMAKMDYEKAKKYLDAVEQESDNQIELLVAHVQNMRLCQRESHNKDFYSYRDKALRLLKRIGEEADELPLRERKRMLYARSEFDIVAATYFYYVGIEDEMQKALYDIDAESLEADTAQYLNYLYNFGSGGAITKGTEQQVAQTEFDYLMQCFILASSGTPYPYWQANSLQAISEHLQQPKQRDFLIKNNLPAIKYLNTEQLPDTLLAGNLAQKALGIFTAYGDTYQIAGGYRTLAECYFFIKDYYAAGNCLEQALHANKAIEAAPDLVASIRERLSLVYSALDDKPKSDYNRNIYLDLQEQTRQDRQLEARAAILDDNSIQLNYMIAAVMLMIAVVVLFLYVFDRMRRKNDLKSSVDVLLKPLQDWKKQNQQELRQYEERYEEVEEQQQVANIHLSDNKHRYLEQRAKVSLVNAIMPFIDRMMHEVDRLCHAEESEEVRQERIVYISELTEKINQYNHVLTQWIQMRQGQLNLHIGSFPLQPLFDIVEKGKLGFVQKGVLLEVQPTDLSVKADRTLTLFMLNTIADNARKFTPRGGIVSISAMELDDSVEIRVADTGEGMNEEQTAHVFDRSYTGGHGFGLVNCKGIIEKYKKVSSLFKVCSITVESQKNKGSVFKFRLPKGIVMRLILFLLMLTGMMGGTDANQSYARGVESVFLLRADAYADSAYFSNINGEYRKTLTFADSAIYYLNRHYSTVCPKGKCFMVSKPNMVDIAEIKWFKDSLPTNYNVILDIRNECAVAALALHEWALYSSNNKAYTQLFRERSADNTLDSYVRTMQSSENSKMVAIVLLIVLLLQLPLAYYFLYYRHVLRYRFAVEKLNSINHILLDDKTLDNEEKLRRINQQWNESAQNVPVIQQLDEVVRQIRESLDNRIEASHSESYNIELAEDELHRLQYENDKLHIANSVLDNCLSSLKHETMYYPSRIKQLIDEPSTDMRALCELVDYYKSLYALLSAQAQEQVEANIKYDQGLVDYLFHLLGGDARNYSLHIEQGRAPAYRTYTMEMHSVVYDDALHGKLFTPLTCDMKYLVCRQIVRDISETTNLRGCGIMAKPSPLGNLMFEIVLPQNEKCKN